jgi:hypothetical protein
VRCSDALPQITNQRHKSLLFSPFRFLFSLPVSLRISVPKNTQILKEIPSFAGLILLPFCDQSPINAGHLYHTRPTLFLFFFELVKRWPGKRKRGLI